MTAFPRFSKGRALVLVAGVLVAVGGGSVLLQAAADGQPHGDGTHAAPVVSVHVQALAPEDVRIWSSFSGRMRAVDSAEIRPEVSGRITEVLISDGQRVKAGDVLFVIDLSPHEAALAKAEADLAVAGTNAAFARSELARAANLIKTDTVSRRVYDERANAERTSQAAILAAEAEIKRARIDLDRAYVKAPIAGRVSRAEITLGNVVQAGPAAPLLTSIVSDEGIYAEFEVDEQTYLRGIRSLAASQDDEGGIPVQVIVPGDEAHPYRGRIQSFDNRIDTSSGTIRARARFDNADGALVPGMFVSVKVASGHAPAALLVSERAIGTDQSKRFVYVVGEGGKVAYRPVELGAQVDGRRVVLAGLRAGDRVIVGGLQHVRPDMSVTVQHAALGEDVRQPAAR